MSHCNIGALLLDLADYTGALEQLTQGLEINQKIKIRVYESQICSWLSIALLNLGRLDEAKQTALKAVSLAKK